MPASASSSGPIPPSWDTSNYEESNGPVGALILGLLAGVLILIDAAVVWAVGGAIADVSPIGSAVAALGALAFLFGLVLLGLAVWAYRNPDQHTGYGAVILVLSLVSVIGGGGFILGTILGVVAGIWLLVFEPDDDTPLPQFGMPSRACPSCGRLAKGDEAYCAGCGARIDGRVTRAPTASAAPARSDRPSPPPPAA